MWNAPGAGTPSCARFPASAAASARRVSVGGCRTWRRTWWTSCCRRCRSASGSAPSRGACATRSRTTAGSAPTCSTASSARSLGRCAGGPSEQLGLSSVEDALIGAVTFIQRVDSALRINPHFHTIALDGAYVRDAEGELLFHALPEPSAEEVAQVARWTHAGLVRVLARHGRSLEGVEDTPDRLRRRRARARVLLRGLGGGRAAPGRGPRTAHEQARSTAPRRPLAHRAGRRGRWGERSCKGGVRWSGSAAARAPLPLRGPAPALAGAAVDGLRWAREAELQSGVEGRHARGLARPARPSSVNRASAGSARSSRRHAFT